MWMVSNLASPLCESFLVAVGLLVILLVEGSRHQYGYAHDTTCFWCYFLQLVPWWMYMIGVAGTLILLSGLYRSYKLNSGVVVVAGGKPYRFPNEAAADVFRRKAGISHGSR